MHARGSKLQCMTQAKQRTDDDLKAAVLGELDWTPSVDPTHIGVGVDDGAITLSGEVESLAEKYNAERAALRVRGVSALANEIVVRHRGVAPNDADIAREASDALDRAVDVPPGAVKAVVKDHVITLSGTVTWQYQRDAAERAVRYLRGVTAVSDKIVLKPVPMVSGVKKAINSALVRNAQLDSNNIQVSASRDGTVTLKGIVQSTAERRQAQYAAWSAPGVTSVVNQLRIET